MHDGKPLCQGAFESVIRTMLGNDLFSNLFEVANVKHGNIMECGYWLDHTWSWNLDWGRTLSNEERADLDLLLDTIHIRFIVTIRSMVVAIGGLISSIIFLLNLLMSFC